MKKNNKLYIVRLYDGFDNIWIDVSEQLSYEKAKKVWDEKTKNVKNISVRQIMDKKHCSGCEQNFYNGNNPYNVKECWHLKDAKMMTRFAISMNAPMGTKSNYYKVKKSSCFQQKGTCFLKQIPDYSEQCNKI